MGFPARIGSALLAVAVTAGLMAQGEYATRRWSVDNGLPQTTVNALAQDDRGYLWIGTFGGLVRFDGTQFTTFDMTSPEPAPNRVRAIVCDPDGSMWIGSDDSGLMHLRGGRRDRLLPGEIGSLLRLADGRIVAAGQRSVWWSSNDRDRFERDADWPGERVLALRGNAASGLIALTDACVLRHRADGWQTVPMADGTQAVGVDADVDQDGAVWLRTEDAIARLRPGAAAFEPVLDAGGGHGLAALDHAGGLWTCASSWLSRWDGSRLQPTRELTPTAVDHIRARLVDREGSLWIGSDDGLLQVRPAALQVIAEPGIRPPGPVLPHPLGGVWVGADHVIAHVDATGTSERIEAGGHVRALAYDPAGGLWACEPTALVHVTADGQTRVPVPGARPNAGQFLRALWVDADGTVWAGGTWGLHRYRDGAFTSWSSANGLADHDVLCICRGADGELWLGTSRGASRSRGDTFETVLEFGAEIAAPVRSIAPDDDGTTWLGTYGRGLCRWRPGDARWFTTADGLPDNCVSAVLTTTDGRVVITTNRGMAEARIEQLPKSDSKGHSCWRAWSTSPQGTIVEAQGGHQPPACVAADGSIWFTAVGGLARRPPTPPGSADEPKARIEQLLTIDGEVLPMTAAVLPRGLRGFTARYTAPSFGAAENIHFRYRLQPLDRAWIDAGTQRSTTFRSLPPGSYELQVAALAAGAETAEPPFDSIRLEIPPLWHERTVVRLAGLMLLVLLGGGFARVRAASLRRHARRMSELVRQRTAELREEVQVRRRAEAELDQRVHERTAELRDAVARLEHETNARVRLQRDLQHAQKMDSLGLLAGGVAHDFNNLLTVINGTAEFGAEDATESAACKASFDTILRAGRTAADLTRQLLIFARSKPAEAAVQQVERRVVDARVLLERSLGDGIELAVDLDDAPWQVLLPPGHIEQILVNTCLNARDAMPGGGKVTIATRKLLLQADAAPPAVRPGEFVELMIRDTGHGMDVATLELALDPFFTTKRGGTGLGLSTCYGIARQAGGTLQIDSDGGGTTVRVLLPRHTADAVPTERKAVLTPARQGMSVLLVDDRDDVRASLCRQLTAAGYRVRAAASGPEALQAVGDAAVAIDALLVDVRMPGMSGPETAKRVLELRPDLRVVFMSGSMPPAELQQLQAPGTRFLPKPFTMAQLRAQLESLAGARPEASDGPARLR